VFCVAPYDSQIDRVNHNAGAKLLLTSGDLCRFVGWQQIDDADVVIPAGSDAF
jgi:hypothetical protein